MATLGDLVVRIGADTRNLNQQLGRVQRNMRSMTSSFTSLGASMTKSITLPLLGIGAAAVKSAADMEQLETSFVSLTGGAQQAAAMMQQLNEFTAKTPFQIDAVAKSARQLIASGTSIDKVNDQLQFLGDIAATSGASIDEIAAIFAKVNAKGKVELENLNQLAERGIPIFKALAEATGLPADALGAGAVSVDQFNQVLRSFSEEGGFAAGAMLRLSNTASGKFSTALDNLKLAGAELGQTLLPAVSKILDVVTDLAKRFASTSGATKQMTLEVGLLVAGIGPLLIFLPQIIAQITALRGVFLALNAVMLANPAGLVVAAIAALTATVVIFRNRTSDATVENDKFIRSLANLDKQAQINHVKEQIRELERERASIQAAQRAEMAAQAAGALGDKLDKQVARGSATRYAEQVEYLDARIEGLIGTVREMGKAQTEVESPINTTTEAVSEQVTVVEKANMTMGQFFSMLENVEVQTERVALNTDKATMSMGEFFSMLENVNVAVENTAVAVESSFSKMADAFANSVQAQIGNAKSLKEAIVEVAKALIIARLAETKANVLSGASSFAASMGPAAPFVLGGTLAAMMALVNQIQIPALAQGGLAFGPSMALIGDNPNARVDPEVIAPLSKLKDMMGGNQVEVYGRISGNDIYISNSRAATARERYS